MKPFDKLIFSHLRDAEEKYPVATTQFERLYNAVDYKMERWYGGNLKSIAKIKGQPVYALIGTDNKTIDIAVDPDLIKINELRELAKENGVDAAATRKKEDIIKDLYLN